LHDTSVNPVYGTATAAAGPAPSSGLSPGPVGIAGCLASAGARGPGLVRQRGKRGRRRQRLALAGAPREDPVHGLFDEAIELVLGFGVAGAPSADYRRVQ